MLNRDMSIALTFVVFDLLAADGEDPHRQVVHRAAVAMEALDLSGPGWATSERAEDGSALFEAVCRLGFEGVVAKATRASTALASAGR